MEFNVAKIALQHINQEDHAFHITTSRDKPSLIESIENIGLLALPTLWARSSGFTIVSGFRRIRACQQLGIQELTVRLVPGDTRPLDCLRIAVADNASQRPFNLIETARAIQRLKKYRPPDREFTAELAALGLPTSRSMITKLDQLGRLNTELQAAVGDGAICLNVALGAGELSREDQMAVLGLFSQLRMSVSKQKEVLTFVKDIAGREKISISEVLHCATIRAIVDDDDLDRNKKTASIRRYLRKIRYPTLSQAEAQYHHTISLLKLGPHIRIDPPPGFEGTTHTLSLRFRNRQDLDAAYRNFGAALENPVLDSLFPKDSV
ncbi:MAG: ParB/RepB/Spo0J family partition protein [Desulfosarcina sp.]|nr:ParB/RepB/Spo0J family partition protein [Desulfobacterales bacterium]